MNKTTLKNSKKINFKKTKFLSYAILSLLIALTYYFLHIIFLTQLSIGIVATNELNEFYLEKAKYGFDKYYNKQFETKITNIKLNSSLIEKQNEYYKNSDFFSQLNKILEKNNSFNKYDYYLIITDKPILDFDESSSGFWGQASTKYNMALITINYFNSGSKQDNFIISNHAVHEVLHLLGYLHNPFIKTGIMQYKNLENMELTSYYKIQLPIKTFYSKFLKPKNFMFNAFIKNIVFFPFLFFLFLSVNYIIQYIQLILYNNYINEKTVFWSYNIILLIFTTFYNYAFFILLIVLFFQIAIHIYYLDKKGFFTQKNIQ